MTPNRFRTRRIWRALPLLLSWIPWLPAATLFADSTAPSSSANVTAKPARTPVDPRSRFIAIGSTDCPVAVLGNQVWDMQTRQATGVTFPLPDYSSEGSQLSPDGSRLLYVSRPRGTDDDLCVIYDTSTGDALAHIPRQAVNGFVRSALFLGDHRVALRVQPPHAAAFTEIWDLDAAKSLFHIEGGRPLALAATRDGAFLAVATDERLVVYSALTGAQAATLAIPDQGYEVPTIPFSGLERLQFSPDGSELAGIQKDTLFVWDFHGRVTYEAPIGDRVRASSYGSIEWSPDSSAWLIDNTRVFDRKSRSVIYTLDDPPDRATRAIFAGPKKLLFLSSDHSRPPVSEVSLTPAPSARP